MIERTLALIKPDAFKRKFCGFIISLIEDYNIDILDIKIVHLTKFYAEKFYEQDKEKDHFDRWTNFMSSGRLMALILEGENVVKRWRDIMGNTDPAKAESHTIRAMLGSPMVEWDKTDNRNSVHGSDSVESAKREIDFFFSEL